MYFTGENYLMKRLLIIEDDIKIREELSSFLTRNGYECEAPIDFSNILHQILASSSDLILLDINLPVYDGYYLCREIRKHSDVPIIVVTSRDTELDELTAMNLGADDFITKPYHTQILLAHIASVLKRASREVTTEHINCGGFLINLSSGCIEYNGKILELTKNEFRIMVLLYEKRGSVVSREELMTQLWNSDMFVDDNTLTVNINRLRTKLSEFGFDSVIETRRGQGYLVK